LTGGYRKLFEKELQKFKSQDLAKMKIPEVRRGYKELLQLFEDSEKYYANLIQNQNQSLREVTNAFKLEKEKNRVSEKRFTELERSYESLETKITAQDDHLMSAKKAAEENLVLALKEKGMFEAEAIALRQLIAKQKIEIELINGPDSVTPTNTLLKSISRDFAKAAEEMPDGLELGDVDIDVRGALGFKNGEVVIGLNPGKQDGGESATRLKFSLRKKSSLRKLE
jgi:uncharacterized protein with PIN domain